MSAMRLDADVAVTGLAWKGRPLGDARTYVRMTDPRDPWIREALAWDRAAPPPGEPCARGRMGLAHGRWPEDPPLRTRDGSIPALDQPMAFVVCGEGLRGKLAFDLAIGRTKVYPLRGRIALEDFDLGPLLPQRGLRGALSAVVDVTGGAMRSDDWLTAEVRVGKLRVGAGDVEIRNDGELRLSLDRGRYAIGRARLIGPSSRLEVSGGGTASTVAARVSGEVDLALLASLSEFVTEAQGLVRLEVRVSGPLASPEAYGTAVIDDATLRSVVLPEPIEGLTGRVTFSQRVVNIENVSARVAGGSVAASGTGILEGRGLAAFDVDVSARDLAMHPADGVELGIGGDARLSWRRGDRVPSLSGVLHVGRLVYTRPIQVGQTLDELSRRARTEVARYDPALDHLQFDLRVVADAPLHVANNLLEADLSIRDAERPFRVVGTDQRFGVLGTMGIDRGVVRFRSTTFDIQRGVLEFDDETRIDPRFDIRAQTTIRRSGDFNVPLWRILLRAYGTTDGFRLDTQSDPELSQEDIVLLLTMGMTRAEAQQLQGGSLGQAAALEALTTVSGVDREVRNAVRVIDDFRLSSGYSLRTQRSEPQVSVGKRISDRVRLSATTGLGEARDFRASVEWQLDDQTSVQGGYDNLNTTTNATLGNLGVDLRWRLEFE
jgi:translocation and assembly module TamB